VFGDVDLELVAGLIRDLTGGDWADQVVDATDVAVMDVEAVGVKRGLALEALPAQRAVDSHVLVHCFWWKITDRV
jgi:uncharacterized protein related to proFAR isomerase